MTHPKKLAIAVALSLASTRLQASTLYALSATSPEAGTLYTIDTATGAATVVVNLSVSTHATDFTVLNITIYALNLNVFSGRSEHVINPPQVARTPRAIRS